MIGPYKFRVTSDRESVMFTKVRFAIAGAAEFVFSLAKEDTLGVATFTGVTDQVYTFASVSLVWQSEALRQWCKDTDTACSVILFVDCVQIVESTVLAL